MVWQHVQSTVRTTHSRLLYVVAALLVAGSPAAAFSEQPTAPLIVAHRGLLHHAPENTLANFQACLNLRIGFEFDVQRTRDGHLVCIHDDTVDRTTNGTGRVDQMTLAELRRLDAGSWFDPAFEGQQVPTLDEVLELVAAHRHQHVLVAVDLKAEGVAREVVRRAAHHKVLQRLLFIGRTITTVEIRAAIREESSTAHSAAVANDPSELSAALNEPHADWVYVRYIPSMAEMDRVRQSGKQSFIAGPTVAGELSANWRRAATVGINAILTDHPLQLRQALTK